MIDNTVKIQIKKVYKGQLDHTYYSGGGSGGGSGSAEGKFGKIYALVERSLNPPIEAGAITIAEE